MITVFSVNSLIPFCQGYTEEEAVERATKIFTSLDHNGDGNLVEDEFVKVRFYGFEGQDLAWVRALLHVKYPWRFL